MNTSLSHTLEYYRERYWFENSDPRLNKSVLLGGTPWPMLGLTMSYLIGVTVVGPYIMRKRKSMDHLIWPIRIYNAFMVAFNTYLYLSFSRKLRWGLDCWGCGKSMERVDKAGLRKKFNHLSLLHITHHTSVPIIVWFAGHLEPTPMVVFAGYINLPIHIIMYTYYCLSTFPNLRRYLWWKKYITTIQIIQFCVDLAHSLQVVFVPCRYHFMTYVQIVFSITFLFLFGQFYIRNYIVSISTKSMKRVQTHEDNIIMEKQVSNKAD